MGQHRVVGAGRVHRVAARRAPPSSRPRSGRSRGPDSPRGGARRPRRAASRRAASPAAPGPRRPPRRRTPSRASRATSRTSSAGPPDARPCGRGRGPGSSARAARTPSGRYASPRATDSSMMYGTGSPGESSAASPHAARASSMMIRKSSVPGVDVRHACWTRNSACTAAPPASLGASARHTRSHWPPGVSLTPPGRWLQLQRRGAGEGLHPLPARLALRSPCRRAAGRPPGGPGCAAPRPGRPAGPASGPGMRTSSSSCRRNP